MTPRERFLHNLNFEKPDDRLPMVEWAAWWDETLLRWEREGLPCGMNLESSQQYFGLDKMLTIGAGGCSDKCPKPLCHGGEIITDENSYEAIRPFLYTNEIIERLVKSAKDVVDKHKKGEVVIRLSLEGFFWYPRTLLGIEGHLFSLYDQPGLIHKINNELTDFYIKLLDALFTVMLPDMIGFAEDMSYNHGPMLSHELFSEFITPYYKKIIPYIKQHGVKVLMDSDGDVLSMIPWIMEAGIDGIYPLERQAGVDIAAIRRKYPGLLMMGGFDKMVMTKGREAIRAEFERILPVMKSGGYIPSVDHQTPPGVSLENYKAYIRLFKEYSQKAIE